MPIGQPRYAHLALALQMLPADALHIWGDATERARAFRVLVEQWKAGNDAEVGSAVARIDDAVRTGFRHLGFSLSKPPQGYIVREGQLPWLARVEGVNVVVAGDLLADLLRDPTGPDRAFRTLVHETIHLRQPRSVHASSERGHRGYEEGFAETLARMIVHQSAGIPAQSGSFDYPVAVYRVFARLASVAEERLYRAVWAHAPGDVRGAFAETVASLYMERHGRTLTVEQCAMLAVFADQQFGTERLAQRPDERAMFALIRKIL